MFIAAENLKHKSKKAQKLMRLVKQDIDYYVIEVDDESIFFANAFH